MYTPFSNRLLATVIVCSLLLQSCRSGLHAIIEEEELVLKQEHPTPDDHVQASGEALLPGTLVLAPSRTDARVSGMLGRVSPAELVSAAVPTSPQLFAGPFTASSGERVLLSQRRGQWQAVLRGGAGTMMHGSTLPVVGSGNIGASLKALQGQDAWSSRSRIHVLSAPHMPSSPCVYVGKLGLLGGAPKSRAKKKQAAEEQAKLTEERLANAEERARLAEERAKLTEERLANADKQVSLSQTALPSQAFGAKEWEKYFGEVGEEPSLPPDIDKILESACPFWSSFWRRKQVKDTHLLVLIPSKVNGKPFTLNLLGELIKHPKSGGYSTKYSYYDSDVERQFGAQSPTGSYWMLMTRDVLEGSRNEKYAAQEALVAQHASRTGLPYELPGALEAVTAILSHYVRSGERLYTDSPVTYTRCQDLESNKYPVGVGDFSSRGFRVSLDHISHYSGISVATAVAGLRKFEEIDARPLSQVAESSAVGRLSSLHTSLLPVPDLIFGKKAWSQYFGAVGEEPCLPPDIDEILGSRCPFWSGKQVKDTHLLVLIPATVNGKPFSLNLLDELIQHPRGGGHSTKYSYYHSEACGQFGAQSPESSYWVLMTRDVLEGSRDETYTSQQALVAQHAGRTGLYYQLPGVLEAATVILSHYVRSGERLYSDNPCTYTRCRDMDIDRALGSGSFLTVGNFLSEGLSVSRDFSSNPHGTGQYRYGVAGLRKF